ncbi:hypothetical protein PVAP13_7KG121360 [Panicum virgatum]|uniref:Uncharacterized protein n=1 Tax=Panicum virgatum TaxID=38727 RepID=A0A8T0QML3_PANVG|nr:hypothetical protein PVAP13_7KG121360 [Panicum virgatum]
MEQRRSPRISLSPIRRLLRPGVPLSPAAATCPAACRTRRQRRRAAPRSAHAAAAATPRRRRPAAEPLLVVEELPLETLFFLAWPWSSSSSFLGYILTVFSW